MKRIIRMNENTQIAQEDIVRGWIRDSSLMVGPKDAFTSYGLDTDDLVGWFANAYNPAFGWHIYKASNFDKKEFGEDVFRSYSETTDTTSIIKFNLLTGTYAFIDNEEYLIGNIVFDRFSKYNRIIIEPTITAFKEFNIV